MDSSSPEKRQRNSNRKKAEVTDKWLKVNAYFPTVGQGKQ
jgi:hypothetical protein